MAGVSEKQLVSMPGWPGGIDNLNPETALARDDQGKAVVALRDAQNVDLSRSGKASRREGYRKVVDGQRVTSLWRAGQFPIGLYGDGKALMGFQGADSFQIADGLTAGLPISFALVGDRAHWSNGRERGVVLADGRTAPWGCPCPPGQPHAEVLAEQGGLDAGRYQVAITWQLATGEESGTTAALLVDVPQGGGIALSNMPAPPDEVTRVRVYVSGAGGDVLYHAMDLAPGMPAAVIGTGRRGRPLDTQFLSAMPAGHIVRWLNGRLLVAADRALCWSEALRYGLTHSTNNRIGFGARLQLMEPVSAGSDGAGVYVADGKRTYWLGGTDPANWTQRIVYSHGAVPGSAVTVEASVFGLQSSGPVPYWLADNGVACLGLPGGEVVMLRDTQVIGPKATAGASLFRERNGDRQVVTALQGAKPGGLAVRDSGVITIERFDA